MDGLWPEESLFNDGLALLRKANALWKVGMALLEIASQSHSSDLALTVSGRFWIFVRVLQFFSRFHMVRGRFKVFDDLDDSRLRLSGE